MVPDKPDARLSSSESYESIAPGFCPEGGCVGPAPMDRATINYEGPIRFFGGGGVGGKGGCVLGLPRGNIRRGRPNDSWRGHRRDVPNQTNLLHAADRLGDRETERQLPAPGVG